MSSEYIDIVFDGPPAPESGRFVEVEDEQQRSISVGDWIEDGDFWRLRISEPYKRIAELESERDKLQKAGEAIVDALKWADSVDWKGSLAETSPLSQAFSKVKEALPHD